MNITYDTKIQLGNSENALSRTRAQVDSVNINANHNLEEIIIIKNKFFVVFIYIFVYFLQTIKVVANVLLRI